MSSEVCMALEELQPPPAPGRGINWQVAMKEAADALLSQWKPYECEG